jgi:hypothetical protein
MNGLHELDCIKVCEPRELLDLVFRYLASAQFHKNRENYATNQSWTQFHKRAAANYYRCANIIIFVHLIER